MQLADRPGSLQIFCTYHQEVLRLEIGHIELDSYDFYFGFRRILGLRSQWPFGSISFGTALISAFSTYNT